MIVYVVVHGDIDGYQVLGVFTNQDKAHSVARVDRGPSWGLYWDVEPIVLDEVPPQ